MKSEIVQGNFKSSGFAHLGGGMPLRSSLSGFPSSLGYSRGQNKKGNKIPVVSVSDRGKQIANYGTYSRIYTVHYEIKGDRGKILGKTIEVGNVP